MSGPKKKEKDEIELRQGRPDDTPPTPRPSPILGPTPSPRNLPVLRQPPPLPPKADVIAMQEKVQEVLRVVLEGNLEGLQEALKRVEKSEIGQVVDHPHGVLKVTLLHLAAYLQPHLVPELLTHSADFQAVDKLGRTALHLACSAGHDSCVALLIRSGADVNSQVEPLVRESSPATPSRQPRPKWVTWVKDQPLGRKPSIRDALPKPSLRNISVGNELPVPECWGRTPLHQAVKANSAACVKLLLKAGASVDVRDEKGLTPLLLAGAGVMWEDESAVEMYEEVVRLLVEAGADVNVLNPDTGSSALHHAAARCSRGATRILINRGADVTKRGANGETPLHEAAHWGATEVLAELLIAPGAKLQVNRGDHVGCTPLHKAAYSGARECLMLLIRHGGDLAACSHSGTSVLDAVFTYMAQPSNFLVEALDEGLQTNNANVLDRSFKVTLDFGVLAPLGYDRQTAVMRGLLTSPGGPGHDVLLHHPLLETFLRLKWRKLRVFFFLLIFIYVCFLVSLSIFIILSHLHDHEIDGARDVMKVIVLCTASLLLAYISIQAVLLPTFYLKALETWVVFACVLLSIGIAIFSDNCDSILEHSKNSTTNLYLNPKNTTNVTAEVAKCMNEYHIIKHVESFTLLLVWTELMLLIGRFPIWGKYALMFYTVLKNVIKVLITFLCIVMGFSLSFFVQFDKNPIFNHPWRSFVKTIVMMTGEFEYESLFNETSSGPIDTSVDNESRLPITSRLIFLLFVIVTSIVMMNLMVGLAVSDIQGLRVEGQFRRLMKQAEFIDHLELLISHKTISRCIPQCLLNVIPWRRSIDTKLVLQPSDAGERGFRRRHFDLPYRLIESCVEVAVKRRVACRRRQSYNRISSISAEDLRQFTYPVEGQSEVRVEELLAKVCADIQTIKEMLDREPRPKSPSLVPSEQESTIRQPSGSESLNRLMVPRDGRVSTRSSRRGSRFTERASEVQNAHVMLRRIERSKDWP